MMFKVDSSESIGSYEDMNEVEINTLEEFIAFVRKSGSDVSVHAFEDEPTIIEVSADEGH